MTRLTTLLKKLKKIFTNNFKSPIGFGNAYPNLMKLIFNKRWFNSIFSNYEKIENIIETALKYSNRDVYSSKYGSYYHLLKIFGEYFLYIIFREYLNPRYTKELLNDKNFINNVKSKYKNIGVLYVNNRYLYGRLSKLNLLYEYFPNDIHSDCYWNEKTCEEISRIFTKNADFFLCYEKAFEMAVENEWIYNYSWIIDRNIMPCFYWNIERVKRLIERKQYKTR